MVFGRAKLPRITGFCGKLTSGAERALGAITGAVDGLDARPAFTRPRGHLESGMETLRTGVDRTGSGRRPGKAMAQRSNLDVAQLEKMRDQANRIASANDEAVLKLSGAGLAVSFAIMRFLGNDAAALIALQAAWVCWLFSTVCLFASFWCGMFGSRIRERAKRLGDATNASAPSTANSWILWLNFGSGLFYVVGMCVFVVFLFMNTPGGD